MQGLQDTQQRRIRVQYAELNRQRDEYLALARASEITTEGVKEPIWTQVLLPMLEREINGYSTDKAWRLKGEQLDEARGAAQLAKRLVHHVLTTAGKRDTYLAEAEKRVTSMANARERFPFLKES